MSAFSTPSELVTEELRTDQSTRQTRIKWVMVVDAELPAGLIANATACLGAVIGRALPNVLGPDTKDGSGSVHPGLPWLGCPILAADAAALTRIRAKAEDRPDIFVADMSELAQTSRVYDEYQDTLAGTEDIRYRAITIAGPRNRIDKLVGGLPLLR
ncbi:MULTISPECIES: DUF2000 domain-containing protein [unclassified Crossiella]|uniref:DUF2000 domain-containing protein n=1 Tax=unclassified Crossiella TaxID=2620835 RepID=UPI001FFF734D|nr:MULTISPECIES: DUF2000 domain-containing protein [unclassified Crossiella]MCK2241949.1 DUF2000 domain-containing protein [Crossiella sp. S99.2]MCK2255852.1 DUF2000 domain-containing protein [Crossiella sp. S99.1]